MLGRSQLLFCLTGLLVALLLSPLSAAPKKKGRKKGARGGGAAAQAQAAIRAELASRKQEVARAKVALAAAQARMTKAEAVVARGQRRVDDILAQIEKNSQDLRAFKSILDDLEMEIERAQPRDSRFARYQKEFAEAERLLKISRSNITNSSRYQAAYQRAKQSTRRTELLSELRDQVEKDEVVSERRRHRDRVAERLGAARRSLLEKNDEWVKTAASARKAGVAVATARDGLTGALLVRNGGRRAYREASQLAAVARDAIQEGEAVIRAFSGGSGSGRSQRSKQR